MAKKTAPAAAKKDQVKSSRSKSSASKSPKTQPKKGPSKTSPAIKCPECDSTYKTSGGLHKHKLAKHPAIVRPAPGRPLKFETDDDLQKAITDYFTSCEPQWIEQEEMIPIYDYKDVHADEAEAKPEFKKVLRIIDGKVQYEKQIKMVKKEAVVPTISGLAYALDTSRRTLLDYEERDEYSHTIKRAKQFIEAANEALLVNGGAVPAGVIFNLKNNWGWVDKSEVSVTDKANAAKKALDRLDGSAPAAGDDDFAEYAQKAVNGRK